MNSDIKIRQMREIDLEQVAEIHQQAFPRQTHSRQWIESSFKGFPRFCCFIAETEQTIVGYIIWAQKSGMRPQTILELDQIAVLPPFQRKGIGASLIKISLIQVEQILARQGSVLKHIIVSTRQDNQAQRLYQKILGAEVEAVIKALYSADEVFMIARNIAINKFPG